MQGVCHLPFQFFRLLFQKFQFLQHKPQLQPCRFFPVVHPDGFLCSLYKLPRLLSPDGFLHRLFYLIRNTVFTQFKDKLRKRAGL